MRKSIIYFALIFMTIFIISCEKKATIPVLTTNEVTQITTLSAISGGVITNDGGATIISKGICWGILDDPTTEDNSTSENGASNTFTSNISGLSPKTKYYVRSYATNSAGTGYGESESFTTIGDIPASTAGDAINIAVDSAVLKGIVNPNLLSTTVSFEWGTTADYGNTITVSQSPVTGSNSVNVSAKLTGLTPKTLYHYRIKAENSLGIIYSNDKTFTTLGDLPAVTSKDVSNLQVNTVTLNGTVNPNYLSTTASFEWGTTTSYGNTTIDQNSGSGNTAANVSTDLTGLNPGTTYHYRIRARNSLGDTYSSDNTFKTLGDKPSVTSKETSNLQINAVTLNVTVNPNYLSTIVTFEWGTTTSYGNTTTDQNLGSGNTAANVSADLTGLNPGTIYHYRINATNELGTTLSNDMTFRTLGDVPSALIESAGNIQYNTATISGQINPNYLSTTVEIEYGTTTSYGNTISIAQGPFTGKNTINMSPDLSGLSQGTLYHIKIKATNELGTTNSTDFTFTTLAPITDIEGNTYNIRTIGTQIWMTENLKTTKYSDGTSIAFGLYYPENNISNVTKFGYLYDWAAAIKQPPRYDTIMIDLQGQRVQGVCPTSWHLPSVNEWLELVNNFGGVEIAGLKLKISDLSYWQTPLLIEEPVSGFNAIPAGQRYINGDFQNCGGSAYYWTSSQFWDGGGTIMGRQLYLFYFQPNVYINITNANNQPGSIGLSVRCLKD